MISSIQLGNIFSSGDKTVVGGSNTGFDTEALVDGLTTAKRLPAVQLEKKLEDNALKRSAFTEFSTVLATYQDAADLLRNPPGVNNASQNIFEYRNANLTTNDGISASTYLSVTAAPGAALSDYNITVDSVATYSLKTTDTFALADEDTVAVGAGLPFNAGTLTLGPNNVDITIDATDTLAQIVTKINAVSDTSNVRATAIQVSDGNYRLQFKTTETGAANNYSMFSTHEQSGNEIVIEAEEYISNTSRSGDTFTTSIDGTASAGNYISAQPSDGDTYNTNIETTAPEVGYAVNFASAGRYYIHVAGKGGSANDSLHIGLNGVVPDSGKSITGFGSGGYTYETISQQTGTDAYIDVATAGVQDLSVYAREDGTQIDQIILTTDSGYTPTGAETSTINTKNVGIFNVGFAVEESATDAQVTIDGTTVTRSTNNIDDLIEDVTFNLNQVTPSGTEVNVEIEPDTEIAKNAILNFVDTYNALRVFYAKQTELNDDGTPTDSAILKSNSTMRSMMNSVMDELTSVVNGLSTEPNKLADLGIELDDFAGDDETPFTRNILVVDEATLDNALVGNFKGVRDVFEFDFVSDNADVQVFNRTNGLDVSDFSLNIDITGGIFQATYSGGTVDLDMSQISGGGYLLKGQDGTVLEGLQLIYGGTTDTTATISISQGIGDRVYNQLDVALDDSDGVIQAELDGLADSDKKLEESIARIDDIVERFRTQQLQRFAALEQLLSSVNSVLQSLDAQANAASS